VAIHQQQQGPLALCCRRHRAVPAEFGPACQSSGDSRQRVPLLRWMRITMEFIG